VEIAPDEWLHIVRTDHELLPMPENGEYFVIWRGSAKYAETWFDWSDGNITTKYPDRATLRKMLQLATALGAKVQGDDGEVYDEAAVDAFDDSFLTANSPGNNPGSTSRSTPWSFLRRLLRRS
jgi:hypothetical protein